MQNNSKVVAGYVIKTDEKLGQGAYGIVHLAKNRKTKEIVAVKMIPKSTNQDPKYLENQLKIMEEVCSENIIKLILVTQTPNNIYFFSELADQDLKKFLKQKGRLSEAEAIFYIEQILNGFAELIRHGFVHRDIKPENILLKGNVIKIADFGLARSLRRLEYSKTFCGSMVYTAPQILRNQPYNYKCDIWSLGIIFYLLVVGRMPWNPLDINEVLPKVLEFCQNYKYPNGIQISAQYKNLIQGCLKVEEQERFDWHEVFNHPIFKGKFKNVCTDFQNLYDLTDLRISIIQKNINVVKLLSKLPPSLNKNLFVNLIRALCPELSQKAAEKLFKNFANQKPQISREQIIKIFIEKKIITEESQMIDQQEQQNKLSIILKRVNLAVQQKQLNPYDLYVANNKKEVDRLTYDEFKYIFIKILDEVSKQQIQLLFNYFCGEEGKQAISLKLFHETFFKILEIPMLEEKQQFSTELIKMISFKKKQG